MFSMVVTDSRKTTKQVLTSMCVEQNAASGLKSSCVESCVLDRFLGRAASPRYIQIIVGGRGFVHCVCALARRPAATWRASAVSWSRWLCLRTLSFVQSQVASGIQHFMVSEIANHQTGAMLRGCVVAVESAPRWVPRSADYWWHGEGVWCWSYDMCSKILMSEQARKSAFGCIASCSPDLFASGILIFLPNLADPECEWKMIRNVLHKFMLDTGRTRARPGISSGAFLVHVWAGSAGSDERTGPALVRRRYGEDQTMLHCFRT